MDALQHHLKAARAKVNAAKEGTPEFDAAIAEVRKVTAQMADTLPVMPYKSQDGDIFSV